MEGPYTIVVGRVLDMLEPEEGDDILPSSDTIVAMLHLLTAAYRLAPSLFPRGAASLDPQRAVIIYWLQPGIALNLHVRSVDGTVRSWIYHRIEPDFAIERDITPEVLIHWFAWFAEHTGSAAVTA